MREMTFRRQCRLIVALTLLAVCASFSLPGHVTAQEDFPETKDLVATGRVLPGVSAGVMVIRRGVSGRYDVLASPAQAVDIYSADGRSIGSVPAHDSKHHGVAFAEDFDSDAQGRIYVADRAADAVKIFTPGGALLRSLSFNAPFAIAALPGGEFAVSGMHSDHLIAIYSGDGKLEREFGAFEGLADREDLNHFLNLGGLASDSAGHVYFAFFYMPEPTIRMYDRYGYAGYEVSLNTLEFEPEAQAMRREIARQDAKSGPPVFSPIITAVGVDPQSQRVWIALRDKLIEFDKDGSRLGTYIAYAPDGSNLKVVSILVEPKRLLLACDPLGIFAFDRPDVAPPSPPRTSAH